MGADNPKENPWTRMRLEREQSERAKASAKRPAPDADARRNARPIRSSAPPHAEKPDMRAAGEGSPRMRGERMAPRSERAAYNAREELRRETDNGIASRRERTRTQAEPSRRSRAAAPARGASIGGAFGIAADVLRAMPPVLVIGACAALLLLVALGAFACSHLGDQEQTAQNPSTASENAEGTAGEEGAGGEERESQTVQFDLSPAAMDNVPDGEGVQAFSLSNLSAPEISAESLTAIEEALAAASDQGDAGFVFLDVDSGRGIARGADTTVYGASSFKAPYAVYVLEYLVEQGTIGLSTMVPVSYVSDPSSYYGTSGHSAYAVSELVEAAVVYSDNNAFGFLRDSYDSIGFDSWLASVGATDAAYDPMSWFPWYCARSSAKLWAEAYDYLQSDTETAQWLGELLSETETSFIRSALEGTGAQVKDKAGWCADADPTYNAVCDAGIIEADGHTYILSIMTGMPDSDANRELFQNIARAVFDTREALNLRG